MEISEERLTALEQKLELTFKSAEKTRQYIFAMVVISIVMVVLPLIGIAFVAPIALESLTSTYSIEGI